jgi:cbb3-type cytochrome oxidase maturation protein
MSFLWITIPVSLLLAGGLLALVVRAVARGDFDDWEGPAARHFLDDDHAPEVEGEDEDEGSGSASLLTPSRESPGRRRPADLSR